MKASKTNQFVTALLLSIAALTSACASGSSANVDATWERQIVRPQRSLISVDSAAPMKAPVQQHRPLASRPTDGGCDPRVCDPNPPAWR